MQGMDAASSQLQLVPKAVLAITKVKSGNAENIWLVVWNIFYFCIYWE